MMTLSREPSLLTTRNSISPFRSSMTAGYFAEGYRVHIYISPSEKKLKERSFEILVLWETNGNSGIYIPSQDMV